MSITHRVCIWIIGLLWMTGCSQTSSSSLKAVKGKIDANAWNFEQNGPFLLDGEWAFYWQQLISSSQISSSSIPPLYKRVPGSWTNYQNNEGQFFKTYGFATYHLQIQLPADCPELALYIPKIWSAANVWVNDKLVYQTGKVSISYEEYENKILEKLIEVTPKDQKIDLVIQVANFDMFIAGLLQNFHLGTRHDLTKKISLMHTWALMWLGALLIMGIYHFILYLFRKKRTSPLFFGIICLLVCLRLVVFGEHYLYEYLKEQVNWFTFGVQSRAYYIITFSLVPLALLYVKSLYPDKVINWVIKTSIGITAIYSIFLLLVSPHFFTSTILVYQVVVFFFIAYLVICLVLALKANYKDAILQTIGIFIMVLAGANDGLHSQGITILGAFELLPMAFAIFLSLQFIIIAQRFSEAFRDVEDLSQNLEKKVKRRTLELVRKTEEIEQKNYKLEKAYQHIKDSVVYASRIQNAILEDTHEVVQSFKEAFIFFRPKDIVSGDFYWFTKKVILDREIKILIAADCTGHGVPGAFMTVMGNDFLNEIILGGNINNPQQILYELDDHIQMALRKQVDGHRPSDGMDLSILVLDEQHKKLSFAGAKNPGYYVRNKELYQLQASKFSIGNLNIDLQKDFHEIYLDLEEGDTFYMASDGFQDQFGGEHNKKYMKKRFRNFLLSISHLTMYEQQQRIEQEFDNWKGDGGQTDDVLLMGIRV